MLQALLILHQNPAGCTFVFRIKRFVDDTPQPVIELEQKLRAKCAQEIYNGVTSVLRQQRIEGRIAKRSKF